ncbi:phage tail tape measure protein [Methylobacterium sp. A54F]
MSRIIEAKAVISAEDRTGKVFDQIARKFRDVGKGAKVSAEIDRMSKALKGAQDGLKGIADYTGKRSAFYQARGEMQAARRAADEAARALANAAKPTKALELANRRAQAAVEAATASYERQKAAVLSSRSALSQSGVSVKGLVGEQARLGKEIDRTTGAIRRRQAVLHAEDRLAGGMSASGRQTMARIAQDRYLVEGMGLAGNAARARRQKDAEAAANARAERRAERLEAGRVLGAGAAVTAGHKGKEIAKDAITSAAEFDLAVRKQKVFTDISGDDQAGLLAQAKRIGQETQFSNIDVVKAQTAAMQGLPAGFSPALKAAVAEGIVGNVRNYSTLMETDLKEGTEVIRSYLQATGKDISTKEKALSEANKATNQLVKMAKLGGMNGEDVGQFVKYAAASSTSAGLSTETMMTLGALARRGGLRGDEAGVAMRSMASKIVAPTDKGIAALNAAGIKHSDYVRMPDKLDTSALEGQFQNKLGKSFTPAVRAKMDAINADKALLADRGKYVAAVTEAAGPLLGKTKKGVVRASDAKNAAKAANTFYGVSGQSVDAEGLLNAAMSKNMTLPQLNAWLTDKHGGKGAITQRQWDEFKASREAINRAGDDPDWAKKKADEVFAGLGGAVENLKGSFENLVLTIGTANSGLIKATADAIGTGLDGFSKLPEGAQQGLSLGAGAGLLGASAWGSITLLRTLLGLGGKVAAPVVGGATGAAAGGGAGAAGAAAGGAAAGGLAVPSLAIATIAGAAFAGYATAKVMPNLAAEKGAAGIDYATGGALEESPMAGLAPERPWLQDWWKRNAPAWAGGETEKTPSVGAYSFGAGGKTMPVEVVSLPSGSDASGQVAALNNTLDKAANASATAANGGKPIEATVKPDQITAKITEIPPVTGSAEVSVENRVNVSVTLNEPMLNAKVEAAAGRAVAKIPLSSSGARPGAVSMPGAAGTPGTR